MKDEFKLMRLSWASAPKIDVTGLTNRDYIYTTNLYNEYCIVTFFDNELTHKFRVIQSLDNWIVQEWGEIRLRTGCIDKYCNYGKLRTDDKSIELIKSFVNQVSPPKQIAWNTERNEGINLLYSLQQYIKAGAIKERHDKIRKSIDDAMLEIKELPKDVERWVEQTLLKPYSYIFYTYQSGKTKYKGYCNYCNTEVEINNPRNRKQGKCPHCHTKIIYIARGSIRREYCRYIGDNTSFAYVQRTKGGICVRYFNVYTKSDIDSQMPKKITIEESNRNFYTDDRFSFSKSYCYGNFMNTTEYRWCKRNDFFEETVYFYPNNLKRICKSIAGLKYMPLDVLARHSKISYTYTFSNAIKMPCAEYLIKLKLYNLAAEVLKRGSSVELNLNGKNIVDVLGIEKSDFEKLQSINPKVVDIKFFKLAKNNKYPTDSASIENLKKTISIETAEAITKYCTLKKAMKYIATNTEQGEYVSDTTNDYKDYLIMADSLGYDMKSENIIFPQSLKDAHGMASGLIKFKKEDIKENAIENLFELYNKLYYFEDKEFIVRPVATLEEFIGEGRVLKHCLARYTVDYAKGRCIILLIRKKSEVDKPYYTLELSTEGKIRQCRGYKNCSMTDGVKAFTEKWLKKIVLQSTAKKNRKAG